MQKNQSTNLDLYKTITTTSLHEDDYVNPYNEKNKLITLQNIKDMFLKFDLIVEPTNISEYIKALTHKSYIKKEYYNLNRINDDKQENTLELFEQSNERLEFLGDTVIKSVIAGYLYIRYPQEDEGFMTSLKANIEDRESLAIFAKKLGLDEYMIISKQIELKDGRNSKKLLEDCFESFVGAVYLDCGFEICRKFIWILLETEIDYSELLYKDKNYKGQLNNFYTQNNWSTPQYVHINTEIINGIKMFIMGVKDVNNNIIAQGKAKSKKSAEKIASMIALKKFGLINEDQMIYEEE